MFDAITQLISGQSYWGYQPPFLFGMSGCSVLESCCHPPLCFFCIFYNLACQCSSAKQGSINASFPPWESKQFVLCCCVIVAFGRHLSTVIQWNKNDTEYYKIYSNLENICYSQYSVCFVYVREGKRITWSWEKNHW